jgi:hypothetical protein
MAAIGLALVTGGFSHLALGQEIPSEADAKLLAQRKPDYSPYPDQHFPNRVFWGDTHHHSSFSCDAGMMGTTLSPEESFRFARGEEVISNSGQRVRLSRPLDFLNVSDHAEFIGLPDMLAKGDPALLANPTGKRWYDMMQAGGREASQAGIEAILAIFKRDEVYKDPKITRNMWERVTAIATKYNEPGKFTAFNGFEWTSAPGMGNNLHRAIVFRDGPERVNQVVPFSAFDSEDPEDLWKYMAAYEQKTGGQVLAIPHNGNLSNGRMFALADMLGSPLTRDYAERRSRWEPLMEVTQSKGTGETHPFLSTEDEFADFELWDFGNMMNPTEPKKKEMLQFEYARSALKNGLMLEAKLGVNPYKFGMIGSTDTHTAMSTVDEDNFFGKLPSSEPSPERWSEPFLNGADGKPAASAWMIGASGLAGVWARENTRESLFDAMQRKEVYGSTGPRITVRLFAGWDFQADEVEAPDFAAQGYKRGVPMGGDLESAPADKAPSFLVRAMRDPDGGNLDRIQIVKGWLDAKGEVHERIYDVAVSDGRTIGADGRCKTPVGNTVDVPNATYKNTIGDPLLAAYWKDPDFDATERAFYYVRVIQIPTPRWTAYDQKRYGIKMADYVPMTVTDRAYTSPVWYTPAK